MSELKNTIQEQLRRLQALTHRNFLRMGCGARSPMRGQGRILALLKLKPEISQRELGDLVNMSRQALAELLAKLERNGLVTREISEGDRRAAIIKLTAEGAKAAENVGLCETESKFLDCLDEEEREKFSEYLGRIIRRYEEELPDKNYERCRRNMDEFMSRHGRGRGFGCEHGGGRCGGRKGGFGRGGQSDGD